MASFSPNHPAETQLRLQPQKRILVLFLPRWATDCLKRADPSLHELTQPFALWEKQQSAMRIAALDERASSDGLFVGQSLADARALSPDLKVREIDRNYLERAFADFADWHSNASPIVSVLTDNANWGDLVLDITGVSHLFGGEQKMLATLTERLSILGFAVRGAIASSVGAAWALAHFSNQQIIGDEARTALASLPIAALRLNETQIAGLNHLGLKSIGQLYVRERKSLQARFGVSLLTRLDQALGQIEERVTPRLPLVERYTERRFPEPIGLMDDVLMATHDLALQLASRLETEAMGAQSFHLFLYRVDHKVMSLSVNAALPTRDPSHIARLFANRAERLEGEYDAGFGIDMIRLAASSVSPLIETQLGVLDAHIGTADLDQLYDRMASRLGPLSIMRNKFVNTHTPELSVKLEPVIARTPDDPDASRDRRPRRPLRLLPQPELIVVAFAEVPDGPPPGMIWRRVNYRFAKSSGPERIGIEWWTLTDGLIERPNPEQKPDNTVEFVVNDGIGLTRDYYIAEDDGGRRFWLFREGLYGSPTGHRWYLHGFFA